MAWTDCKDCVFNRPYSFMVNKEVVRTERCGRYPAKVVVFQDELRDELPGLSPVFGCGEGEKRAEVE